MTKPDVAELSTFDTDFGVTFGHVVCFDLMFKSPLIDMIESGISHILYPTAWFQETPSLTANQIQQGFAQSRNVVLLASGANWPDHSQTGSGIFVGRHGAVEKIISYKEETRMLIAEVPKNVNDPDFVAKEPSIEPYSPAEMDKVLLFNYNWPTSELSLSKKVLLDDIFCEFSLNYTEIESNGYNYRLVAVNTIRPFMNVTTGGEAHCSIVSCMNEENCGQKFGDKISSIKFHGIEISMAINENIGDFNVMPSTLDNSLNALSPKLYEFSKEKDGSVHKFTIKSSGDISQSLLTFGIYGRHFTLDGQPVPVENIEHVDDEFSDCTNEIENSIRAVKTVDDSENSNFALKATVYVLVMVFLCIITGYQTYRRLQTPYIRKHSQMKRKSVNFA